MAEKKRMAFNPLDERKPKGMDGLIRDTRNMSDADEAVPMESADNAKTPGSATSSQPSEGRKPFGNVVKVIQTKPVADSTQEAHDTHETLDALDAQDAHIAQLEQNTSSEDIAQIAKKEKKQSGPRINLAIDDAADDFLKVMAGAHGISVTKYLNQLIEADKQAKSEQYLAIKALIGK